ncbi:hypothetical protein WJX81_005346 [Elliptochloris bilobata]|uniref:DNA ligase 4 n=1 Tax=Elliptochloris bilobata TaxID=381761 RepID=A0AAW1RKF1_9CHLO
MNKKVKENKQLRVETLCQFLDKCLDAKPADRIKHLRKLMDEHLERKADDLFQVFRLILPSLDRQRGNFQLKESALAQALVKACGLDKTEHKDAQRALNWRDSKSVTAGNFAKTMEDCLFTRCKYHDKPKRPMDEAVAAEYDGRFTLTVGKLNDKLDELVVAGGGRGAAAHAEKVAERRGEKGGQAAKAAKAAVLRELMDLTTPRQMRWIVQIILGNLKVGLAEKSVLNMYHPDAEDLINVNNDLEKLLLDLRDPDKRIPRQSIQPGSVARAQLARMCSGPEEAFKLMAGRDFIVEAKYDGNRMQVHLLDRDEPIQYYSRRGVEHGAQSNYSVLDEVVKRQVRQDRVILDGEVVVWNKTRQAFEPFGGFLKAVNAARSGRAADELLEMNGFNGEIMTADPDYTTPRVRDLEVVYVAFDVLYCDGQSVINRPLVERHQLLNRLVSAAPAEGYPLGPATVVTGRVIKLLPGQPLPAGMPGSRHATDLEDIQDMFEEVLRVKEEGIVVKAADSPWRMNDRSTSWLKIKPEYVEKVDIDALIIGGWWGRGRRGGLLSQYLLALLEDPVNPGSKMPPVFLSFCKVGSGISDAEMASISDELRPFWIETDKDARVPGCYRVVDAPKVRPDVWIKDPLKSIVVKVHADVRFIQSVLYASRLSLRFPRVDSIRRDKGPLDIQTCREVWDLVNRDDRAAGAAAGGSAVGGSSHGGGKSKKAAAAAKARRASGAGGVVEHFRPADLNGVQVETDALAGAVVYFFNCGRSGRSKAELEGLVKRLGGQTSQNYVRGYVTHVVASEAEASGPVWRSKVAQGLDIVALSWLLECGHKRAGVALRPRHYLARAPGAFDDDPNVDRWGDEYFVESTDEDIAALTKRMVLTPADIDASARLAREELDALPGALPRRGKPDMDDILLAFDKELEAAGKLDPDQVANAAIASAATARVFLAGCIADRVGNDVIIRGGQVTKEVDARTTHLVVLPPPQAGWDAIAPDMQAGKAAVPAWDPTVASEALLRAVRELGGGIAGLAAMRRGLRSGELHLVTQQWLEESVARAQTASFGKSCPCASEAEFALRVTAPADASAPARAAPGSPALPGLEAWPWEAAGLAELQQRSGSRASARSRSCSGEHSRGEAASRGVTGGRARGGAAPRKAAAASGNGAALASAAAGARKRAAGDAADTDGAPAKEPAQKRRGASPWERGRGGTGAAAGVFQASAEPNRNAPRLGPSLRVGGASAVPAMDETRDANAPTASWYRPPLGDTGGAGSGGAAPGGLRARLLQQYPNLFKKK